MKATYVGDTSIPASKRDIPDVMETLGLVFEKGKATDIPPALEAKLAGNPHFELSGKETAAK
jgi:hypothetical protein